MPNKEAPTYVRLDEQTEDIVSNLSEEKSLSKSSAIRLIIREWAQLKAGMVTIQKVGVIKDGKIDSEYL